MFVQRAILILGVLCFSSACAVTPEELRQQLAAHEPSVDRSIEEHRRAVTREAATSMVAVDATKRANTLEARARGFARDAERADADRVRSLEAIAQRFPAPHSASRYAGTKSWRLYFVANDLRAEGRYGQAAAAFFEYFQRDAFSQKGLISLSFAIDCHIKAGSSGQAVWFLQKLRERRSELDPDLSAAMAIYEGRLRSELENWGRLAESAESAKQSYRHLMVQHRTVVASLKDVRITLVKAERTLVSVRATKERTIRQVRFAAADIGRIKRDLERIIGDGDPEDDDVKRAKVVLEVLILTLSQCEDYLRSVAEP